MESINNFSNISKIRKNKIYVNADASFLENSIITFYGENNIAYIEDGVIIKDSNLSFNGSNGVLYLSSNKHTYYLKTSINNNTCIYFGANCYINGAPTLVTSEQQNIVIGDDGLFAFGIFFRTSDPHLIYDIKTKLRINESKSVLIGDHVWIGQNALLLKGTIVGSGSIIGGNAVLSNKTIPSNVAVIGNPAKVVRENIFFSKKNVHSWLDDKTEKNKKMDHNKWIYKKSKNTIDFTEIDQRLKDAKNADVKIDIIKKTLVDNKNKNRFAIKKDNNYNRPTRVLKRKIKSILNT